MRSRKKWEEIMLEANEEFVDWKEKTAAMIVTIPMLLLDIREILEGIDRRLGAAAIKKSVKKVKKHGTS